MDLRWTSEALVDLVRLHEFLAPVNSEATNASYVSTMRMYDRCYARSGGRLYHVTFNDGRAGHVTRLRHAWAIYFSAEFQQVWESIEAH